MTSIEVLTRWLAAITLTLGSLGIVWAAIGEVRFRRAFRRRLVQLQALRVELDLDRKREDDIEQYRAALLRKAENAFGGVLTRDLARDPQLAELFEDVCRRLAPATPGYREGASE